MNANYQYLVTISSHDVSPEVRFGCSKVVWKGVVLSQS